MSAFLQPSPVFVVSEDSSLHESLKGAWDDATPDGPARFVARVDEVEPAASGTSVVLDVSDRAHLREITNLRSRARHAAVVALVPDELTLSALEYGVDETVSRRGVDAACLRGALCRARARRASLGGLLRALDQARHQGESLRSLVMVVADPVLVVGPDARVHLCNLAAEAELGADLPAVAAELLTSARLGDLPPVVAATPDRRRYRAQAARVEWQGSPAVLFTLRPDPEPAAEGGHALVEETDDEPHAEAESVVGLDRTREVPRRSAPIDVHVLLRETYARLSWVVDARARLLWRLEDVPAIDGDDARLGDALANVLLNAVEALDRETPERNRILVGTRRVDDFVEIEVTDTGLGILPQHQQRVFEPYFSTKMDAAARGLGLTVAVEIVREHRGTIEVFSRPGTGTQFRIRLPVAAPPSLHSRPIALTVDRGPGPRPDHGGRILIIDDEPLLRDAFRRMLGKHHRAQVACDGVEGLAVLRGDHGFDVVVCDLMMPEIDGPMLYERIVGEVPSYRERFVFCTGGALTERTASFLRRIDGPVLEKPFASAELMRIVDGIVRGRGERRPD